MSQTKKIIKISCQTYLKTILQGHGWLFDSSNLIKTPMQGDAASVKSLSEYVGPIEAAEHALLQKSMGFSFCQTIGQLLFAAVTCCPNILDLVISLSQFSNNLTEVHYIAVKQVF